MNTKYLEIIKAPVVTEKSTNGKNLNQYTFKVSTKATKNEIKESIEQIFNVEVEESSTLNDKQKQKELVVIQDLVTVLKRQLLL